MGAGSVGEDSNAGSIRRYERADCTLFRIPPVDFSAAGKVIERVIVKAWEQGSSAEYALDSLLREGKITAELAQQIAPSLQFQRQHALGAVEEEKAKAFGLYGAEREQQLQGIEERLGTAVQERYDALQQAAGTADQQKAAYSAAQLRLDELRARVHQHISELGGVEGYNLLSQIRDAVVSEGEGAYQQQVSKSSPVGSASLEEIVKREKTGKLEGVWSALVNVATFRYLRKQRGKRQR